MVLLRVVILTFCFGTAVQLARLPDIYRSQKAAVFRVEQAEIARLPCSELGMTVGSEGGAWPRESGDGRCVSAAVEHPDMRRRDFGKISRWKGELSGLGSESGERAYLDSVLQGIRVIGVLCSKNSRLAIIEEKANHRTGFFRENDEIDQCRIRSIAENRIVLAYRGEQAVIPVAASDVQEIPAYFQAVSANERFISRSLLSQFVLSAAGEANQLVFRQIANARSREIEGLCVTNIKNGGLIEELGLKNNDVIKSVNGFDVQTVPQSVFLLSRLQKKEAIELKILRNNQPLDLKFFIRK
ncbi:MAG: hypothetical protein NC924_09700 [Candidatus Omnitrophica bacterium]|nr:hypothetical protein [Candidatus Omnitrophota bacterium]